MRTWALPFAIAALLATACSGGGDGRPAPRACSTDDECGTGWCVRGACVADAPPRVEISAPATVRASSIAEFAASITDPDADDSVASVRWVVTPVADGCNVELEEAAPARLRAIFWCAGTYELELVAVDAHGVEGRSEPVRVVAEPSPSAPHVGAAGPLSVPHRCAGEPLACEILTTAGSPLQLGADALDGEGGALRYEWSVTPPAGADAKVTFEPSPSAQSPVVRITSTTGAIAGDWRFRVRVQDPEGLLAQAFQVVTVENTPPTFPTDAITAPHSFAAPLYFAEGTFAVAATDPDGDPVRVEISYAEPTETGCTAAMTTASGSSALRVACEAASSLIGKLERKITVVATDASGGSTTASIPFVIQNRPPTIATRSGTELDLSANHTVQPCGSGTCFVAAGESPFTAADPDGDPVAPISLDLVVAPSLTHSWAEARVSADGTAAFAFGTPIEYGSEFRSHLGFTVVARASDPFETSERSAPLTVLNRPPVAPSIWSVSVAHAYDGAFKSFTASTALPAVTDPDGDPVTFSGSGSGCGVVGSQLECRMPFDWTSGQASPLPSFLGSHSMTLMAFDGWDGVQFGASINVSNDAPSVQCAGSDLDLCTCQCSKWVGDTCVGARLVWTARSTAIATIRDPNGDPLTASASGGAPIASPSSCGPTCTVLASVPSPGTYTFTVSGSDGVRTTAPTSCTATFGCGAAGASCTF